MIAELILSRLPFQTLQVRRNGSSHHSVGKCQDGDAFQVCHEPAKPLSQESTQSCKEKLQQGKCRSMI